MPFAWGAPVASGLSAMDEAGISASMAAAAANFIVAPGECCVRAHETTLAQHDAKFIPSFFRVAPWGSINRADRPHSLFDSAALYELRSASMLGNGESLRARPRNVKKSLHTVGFDE